MKKLTVNQNQLINAAFEASSDLAYDTQLARSEIRNALTTAKRMTRLAMSVEAIPGADVAWQLKRRGLDSATIQIDGPDEALLRAAMELLKRIEGEARRAFRCIDKIPQDA